MALGGANSKVNMAPGGEGLISFDYMAPGITRLPKKVHVGFDFIAPVCWLLFVDDLQ
jgi:hypothetical protein